MMDKPTAEFAVNALEKAIIEAQHKLANDANKHYVNRLKSEMVELLTTASYQTFATNRIGK